VELRVEPKLPGEVTSPAHQVAPPPQANLADEAQARTYVVLRPTEWKPKSSPALPFLIVDDFGTIGLEVQGSADGPSGDFFQVGASYTFATRQGNQAYVVLGKYRSPDAAGMVSEAFLANETWYSMSSEESLRLGKGPWFRG